MTIAQGSSTGTKLSGSAASARDGGKSPALVICTAMTVMPGKRVGSFILTRKFLDGVLEYVRHWPGSVAVWVERASKPDSNLDHVEVHPDDLPFDLRWLPHDGPDRFEQAIASADLMLAALVDKHVILAEACRAQGVPLVYVTEYSVKTRRQIIYAETRNPILRWRRELFNKQLERQFERVVPMAAGVQCNGWPTYEAYSDLNSRALLYFDTRVRQSQLISPTALELRLSELRSHDRPLRLAFSGRLIAMKGADHLTRVARELKRLDIPFTMQICGGGALETSMRRDIARFGLKEQVRLRGVLDFERELVPFIARHVDLFVCCHRQGDPSCTYLETYSCGVPIVGYDNEAFAGLAASSGVGGREWVTPMDDPITLARKIADLNGRRDEIAQASHNALTFATQHTFEHTMRTRVQHMLECMRAAEARGQRSEVSPG